LQNARIDDLSRVSVRDDAASVAEVARNRSDGAPFGPEFGPTDEVEAALARALDAAATAGRFDVVAQLARELEARRLAAAGNVVSLPRKGWR
jgi:hypothetical protein